VSQSEPRQTIPRSGLFGGVAITTFGTAIVVIAILVPAAREWMVPLILLGLLVSMAGGLFLLRSKHAIK